MIKKDEEQIEPANNPSETNDVGVTYNIGETDNRELEDPTIRQKYAFAVKMKIMDREDDDRLHSQSTAQQEKWTMTTKANKKAGLVEVLELKLRQQYTVLVWQRCIVTTLLLQKLSDFIAAIQYL